ncbi:MAG: DUF885 domain-containing protein [Fimbriimonadaceae bacterium]|nr:DUF885 domain-containing protein [Fimbriimonadaceae bacterium]
MSCLCLLGCSKVLPTLHKDNGLERLNALCSDFWELMLRTHPDLARRVGDPRYQDHLEDIRPAALMKRAAALRNLQHRLSKIDSKVLVLNDRISFAALTRELEKELFWISSGFHRWSVSTGAGPLIQMLDDANTTHLYSNRDAESYIVRCRKYADILRVHADNLSQGLHSGLVANKDVIIGALKQIDELIQKKPQDWPLLDPLRRETGLNRSRLSRLHKQLLTCITTHLRPAFARYGSFLKRIILPKARSSESPGLVFLENGRNLYRKAIRVATSGDYQPEELHELGLMELRKIRTRIEDLGGSLLGERTFATILNRLRDEVTWRFVSSKEIEDVANAAMRRAERELPKWFSLSPPTTCLVRPMTSIEAVSSGGPYYSPGPLNRNLPGYFMYNPLNPAEQPRFEMEDITFHETLPGHHMQLSIAAKLKGIPEFRKWFIDDDFSEGWALYAEGLADEMGLYSSDLYRIGMLTGDALRCARLVVDTGIHYFGWSRQRAIRFMQENTGLSPSDVLSEVDRYIATPGQALAYKCGQLEIMRLREEGKRRMGDRFDIRRFHDILLKGGGRPFTVIRDELKAYFNGQVNVTTHEDTNFHL